MGSFRAFLDGLGARELNLAPTKKSASIGTATDREGRPEHVGGSARPRAEEVEGRPTSRREPRVEPREEDGRLVLPPPALLAPIERSAPAPVVGSSLAHAEAAALAERVLTSLRVGRVSGSPEVRMRLGGREGRGMEVRLRLDGGTVVPVLVTEHPAEAEALAARLDALFAERGIAAEQVVIERG
jgi:hypothetical protein